MGGYIMCFPGRQDTPEGRANALSRAWTLVERLPREPPRESPLYFAIAGDKAVGEPIDGREPVAP
jgi:hypothetical protein